MRGIISDIDVLTAKDLAFALKSLKANSVAHEQSKFKILAGNTDLGVEIHSGKSKTKKFLDIWPLRKELAYIKLEKDQLRIGALATFSEIRDSALIRKNFPNLSEAAKWIGGVQIQNRATIGGNIVNASPAGDSLPALMSYGAKLKLFSDGNSQRLVPFNKFYEGYKKLNLKPEEMLGEVVLPLSALPVKKVVHFYRKVGTRQAQAISKVVASGFAVPNKSVPGGWDFQFSLGSVFAHTVVFGRQELFGDQNPFKNEKAGLSKLQELITPQNDIRSTKTYRQFVSGQLLAEFLKNVPGIFPE